MFLGENKKKVEKFILCNVSPWTTPN